MEVPKVVIDVLRVAAPTLLKGLLGPLGGIVATLSAPLLEKWLGPLPPDTKVTPQLVTEKIQENSSDPELLERLRKVERTLQQYEDDQGFKFAELEVKERQSNRDFQSEAGIAPALVKWGMGIVVFSMTMQFLTIAGCIFLIAGIFKIPFETASMAAGVFGLIGTVVGYIAGYASQIIGFYWGGSKGRSDENNALTDALQQSGEQLGQAAVTAAATASKAAEVAAAKPTQPQVVVVPTAPVVPPSTTTEVPKESRFTSYIGDLLQSEGGYVNDPRDNGGCTNFGITIGTLRDWRGVPVTCDDVQALTWEEARSIYFSKYWNALQCDSLPSGLDYMVFDFGVNAGTRTSARLLQECLQKRDQKLKADGVIGPLTLAVLAGVPAKALIDEFHAAKMAYYKSLDDWQHFGNGWSNRANTVLAVAKSALKASEG